MTVSVGGNVGDGLVTFNRLVAAVTSWSMHRTAGVRVKARAAASVGQIVTVGIGPAVLRLSGRCVVQHIVDSDNRFEMTYRTLPGHPENGVERFALSLSPDGVITAEITAVSRPAHPVLRRFPASALLGQQFMADRYIRALRRIAGRHVRRRR